jgi:hypothetical protein
MIQGRQHDPCQTKHHFKGYRMTSKLLFAGAFFAVAALGCSNAIVTAKKGDSELGLFSGAVIPPGGGGAKLGGGANYAWAINKYFYPYGEFSYLPGALNQSVSAGTEQFNSSGDLADFHGGLHVRKPITTCFVPYGVVAVGAFRQFSGTLDEVNLQTGRIINSSSLPSTTEFAFNYGGGVRYYITEKIGVRFEVKAYGPTSHFGGTPVRVMAGIFFQFKRH